MPQNPSLSRTSARRFEIHAKFIARTDVGKRRNHNEDNHHVDKDGRFCVVADGMGGHAAGEVASRLAVELVSRFAEKQLEGPALSGEQLTAAIKEWVQSVNSKIHSHNGKESSAKKRMGTTVVFLGLFGDLAAVGHVGDSRAYLLREGKLEMLTADHSIYSDQIEKSRLPAKDRNRTRKRKYITKAMGTRPTVEADVRLIDLAVGDVFLLCSDGLTDMVADVELQQKLNKGLADLNKVVDGLVNTANRRGGHDNITVIAAEILAD